MLNTTTYVMMTMKIYFLIVHMSAIKLRTISTKNKEKAFYNGHPTISVVDEGT